MLSLCETVDFDRICPAQNPLLMARALLLMMRCTMTQSEEVNRGIGLGLGLLLMLGFRSNFGQPYTIP